MSPFPVSRVTRNKDVPGDNGSNAHSVKHLACEVHSPHTPVHQDQLVGDMKVITESHGKGMGVDGNAERGVQKRIAGTESEGEGEPIGNDEEGARSAVEGDGSERM